jgi:NAD(P)H-hydrate epimerase
MQNPEAISYLTQREAAEIDEILMGPLGFSVDQLMVSSFFFSLLSHL